MSCLKLTILFYLWSDMSPWCYIHFSEVTQQSIKTRGIVTQRVESLRQLLPGGIRIPTMSKNKKEPEAVFPFYCMVTPCSPTLKVPVGAPLELASRDPTYKANVRQTLDSTSWAFISNWMTPLEPSSVILRIYTLSKTLKRNSSLTILENTEDFLLHTRIK